MLIDVSCGHALNSISCVHVAWPVTSNSISFCVKLYIVVHSSGEFHWDLISRGHLYISC